MGAEQDTKESTMNYGNAHSAVHQGVQRILVGVCLFGLMASGAFAIDPTELEPAEGMEAKSVQVEQKVVFEKNHSKVWTSETSVEYALSERWAVELGLPYQIVDGGGDEVGDVGFRVKHIFNPGSESGFVAGVTVGVGAAIPTRDDSHGVHGDLHVRLSKWNLGESEKHGVHATLEGKYNNDAESGKKHVFQEDEAEELDFRFAAVLGYTYQATPSTNLVVDFVREQLVEKHRDGNLIEVGLTHKLSESTTVAVGAGVGLGDESPDYLARAGVQFRF